ncbi:MAG: hypothetical protein WD533_05030, partial [Dehalococcoidia bacterium]
CARDASFALHPSPRLRPSADVESPSLGTTSKARLPYSCWPLWFTCKDRERTGGIAGPGTAILTE